MKERVLLLSAVLVFLLAVSAPVRGELAQTAWNVQGVAKIKVKIKGIGSESATESISDEFLFSQDRSFSMTDSDGTWEVVGKKFYVHINEQDLTNEMQALMEEALAYENIDATMSPLDITQNDFSGKENKNGTMKGKWKLALACSIDVASVEGTDVGRSFYLTLKMTTTFTGTRQPNQSGVSELESFDPEEMPGAGGMPTPLEAIGIRIGQAVAREALFP
jgi:hypothetical protein